MLAVGLLIVAVVLLIKAFSGGSQDAPSAPATPASDAQAKHGGPSAHKPTHLMLAHSLDPSLRFDLLKSSEDVTYKGSGRDIFHSTPEMAEIPKAAMPDVQPQGPPPKPPPPPIDLKFYGLAGPKNGNKRIFLLKGEDIFLAKEGDIVDRRYKIVHIGPSSVEVEDVLTNNTQTLPFTG